MAEVNEEIVRAYYESQGFFVRTRVRYFRRKDKAKLKGSGYGDLDILATHPDGRRVLVAVTGWHNMNALPSDFTPSDPYLDELALGAARKEFRSGDYQKALVVSRFNPETKDEVVRKAKEQGIDEVIDYATILRHLFAYVRENEHTEDLVLHVIRVLKVNGVVFESPKRPRTSG
jgi:hypothetical protein